MARKSQPVLTYLQALHDVRATGKATDEQSYKSKLEALLTAIGEDFDPERFALAEVNERLRALGLPGHKRWRENYGA